MKCLNYPSLNAKQKKAIKTEASRQAKKDYQKITDLCTSIIDAAMLLALRRSFGFGEQRLKRAYFEFFKMHKELSILFDAEKNEDLNDVYALYLKNLGFDLKAWDLELTEELKKLTE